MVSFKKWLTLAAFGFLTSTSFGCATTNTEVKYVKIKKTIVEKKVEIKKVEKSKKKSNIGTFLDIVSTPKKLKLFNLEELLSDIVDSSNKTIKVDVVGYEKVFGSENNLKKQKDIVFDYVKEFYKKEGIDLEFKFTDKIDKKLLNYTKHLAIEFNENEEELSGKYIGRANLKKKKITLSPSKFEDIYDDIWIKIFNSKSITYSEILVEEKENMKQANKDVSNSIIHELGHSFGLYHTHYSKSDPFPDYSTKKVPNCMSYEYWDDKKGCDLNDLQKLIIHSYLSGGRIYKAFELVNFDMGDYVMLTSISNNHFLKKFP